jgi:hypothetical protein
MTVKNLSSMQSGVTYLTSCNNQVLIQIIFINLGIYIIGKMFNKAFSKSHILKYLPIKTSMSGSVGEQDGTEITTNR